MNRRPPTAASKRLQVCAQYYITTASSNIKAVQWEQRQYVAKQRHELRSIMYQSASIYDDTLCVSKRHSKWIDAMHRKSPFAMTSVPQETLEKVNPTRNRGDAHLRNSALESHHYELNKFKQKYISATSCRSSNVETCYLYISILLYN